MAHISKDEYKVTYGPYPIKLMQATVKGLKDALKLSKHVEGDIKITNVTKDKVEPEKGLADKHKVESDEAYYAWNNGKCIPIEIGELKPTGVEMSDGTYQESDNGLEEGTH
ncbi:hypothetical protein GGI06_003988 [Coemansia sp. S85]|nr:hypothetical protein GGI06_003988 [Coemansia sp. S85]